MSDAAQTPLGRLIPRHVQPLLDEALADTRVVLVAGARQSGKSTLVRQLGRGKDAEWRNLDRSATLEAARSDPTGFVAFPELMVIDEIQRAPELLLAIKEQVDTDPRPGRYLLTGSARVLGLRALPDTLPGRMETIELWPFSQGEIEGQMDVFVDAAFADGPELRHKSTSTRNDYAARILRGGFPEAVARTNPRRRERFFDAYTTDLITRDVSQLSDIERTREMQALLRLLAARAGHLLVERALSNETSLSASTVRRYLSLLEEVFLIKRIPAWSRNLSRRATAIPKLAFVDSGVAANLLAADARSLVRPGSPFGPLLESFVLMEIARQLTWSDERAELSHYRTKDGVEVDAVLENRQGRVVAIEVKAASTVRTEDFRGLRHLIERVGDDVIVGIVLYTGGETLPFGPRLRAVPISALWEVS
jgi:predicted AAA+ superfamily ATPase